MFFLVQRRIQMMKHDRAPGTLIRVFERHIFFLKTGGITGGDSNLDTVTPLSKLRDLRRARGLDFFR
tara:strand:- start:153 stop:353 length:201 start_codon:yes stop_codon:yes gene_type:complete